MNTDIIELDKRLYESLGQFNILDAIAPQNYKEEKRRFFETNYASSPAFTYARKDFDIFKKKRELYNFPVEELQDPDLVSLYTDVIESYIDKLDQFKSLGTNDFLYDSLRYYGEPSVKDIRNARFILHLPGDADTGEQAIDANGMLAYLEQFAKDENYTYQLVLDDRMIANALVSGTTVKINARAQMPQSELAALAHHELGVHLATTLNARSHDLRVMSLGTPLNTMTQEGLAILCEYLSGHLTMSRLKNLALRVLAVESMIRERDFKKTFLMLKEDFSVSDEQAFTISARVYRGGGFTKDYLYLRGFHLILNAYEERNDFINLLSGKTSISHLDVISRLIEKQYLKAPQFISPAIRQNGSISSVQAFIAHAIK